MTRDELLRFHERLCKESRDLMNLKNRDYAGNHGSEPFANFTRCEAMGICDTEQGFMVRITDKMSRLSSFLDSGKMHVEDESFHDTVIDVINYMVLLAAYTKDKDSKELAQERREEDEAHRKISRSWSQQVERGLYCKDE
mgnify:CR=1 FL=1